jgi:hypothetical protein
MNLLHRLPQLLVGHIQISLRGFQICMTEQELNRFEVKAARQPTAGGFVA